jgi:archaetidylinositol phosphate synthase
MLDGLSKHLIDPVWEKIATPLVHLKVTPNQVTVFGLFLVAVVTLAFLWHQSTLLFGLSLAVAFAFDSLDGAVARRRDMQSKFGGYLDAVIDRYQELTVFLALGIYTQQ